MTDTETTSLFQTVLGLLWGVTLIVVPGYLWTQGIHPTLMLGVSIGSAVRLLTDMGLIVLNKISDGNTINEYSSSRRNTGILLVVVQFGTLIAATGFWLLGGDTLSTGIVLGMLLSYALFIVYGIALVVTGNTETEDSNEMADADEESEWKFELDDV